MASLYPKKKSPFFWLQYKDEAGKWHQVSTKCRIGVAPEVRRAKQMEAEKTLEELKYGDARKLHEGWAWVPDFMKTRYRRSNWTLERYMSAWATLRLFIEHKQIASPANFRRHHCFEFVEWRSKPDKANGKYRAKLNTILLDLKLMGVIMQEAVEREMIVGNPCLKLGIQRDKPAEKPELSDEDCETISAKIQTVADPIVRQMLAHSFEIARYQGCRLSETRLNPQTDVTIVGESGEIRFRAKGARMHVTLLHPKLVPFFRKLQQDGATSTWDPPKDAKRQWASNKWYKFLDRIGLKEKGVTFHGTRVTVATKMARNNVPENKAMKYLGHASTTVTRIYQRLRPKDLGDCTDAIE